MTDYSKMSDGEINIAVAKLMGTYRYVPENLPCDRHLGRNYCNSWADAGPIAEKKGITISAPMKYDNPALWLAYPASNSDLCVTSEKPCRAICIAFMMMNEGD